VRASKRVITGVDALNDWDAALALSKAEIVSLLQTKDAIEGVTAFAQKRKPNWING
jgi:crotonobetainyl-CoA hydratase